MHLNLKTQLFLSGLISLISLLLAVFLVLRGFIAATVILILVACVWIIALNIWFLKNVTDPLEMLTRTAEHIAEGSYGTRAEISTDNEIGDLGTQINEMSTKTAIAEKSRTEFISQISHELRTPLTAIEGWAETIAYDEAVQGDSLRGINIISKEAERLTGMVTELLEFARIQDGRFNLRVELIDIAAELEDALFTYGELLKQAGTTLNYTAPEQDIPLIPADAERLKQVFLNLLDNASKHGGEGGTIDVSLLSDNEKVTIICRDHGKGIPESELPHVKEKFYKGSSKNRGTGIGLAVSDEIVARHGGTLEISNAEGGGCMVTVTLPCNNGEIYG
ncbi:MAG: HAMP domain-containing histidine kinase [Oscillospiraceae bacterium]|nr:HAMP domain-containing histidine kinase [Oscillospiraceae bacterium]